jgi:hypothetical protein
MKDEAFGGAALATGYCVKCKATREIKDAQQITMKNGRPAVQGICPVCGTKIFKIGAMTPSGTRPAAPQPGGAPDEGSRADDV